MIKERLEKLIKEHWNSITIIWYIVVLSAMIITLKVGMNYRSIIDEEEKIKSKIANIEEEIAYSENFYKKYLDSDFAPYFLAHKNNSLFDWEKIIRLIEINDQYIEQQENGSWDTTQIINSPQKAWKLFIKSKIQ